MTTKPNPTPLPEELEAVVLGLRQACSALYLEVPEAVAKDVRQKAEAVIAALDSRWAAGEIAGVSAAIKAVQSVYMTREPLTSPEREYYAEWQSAVTDCERRVTALLRVGK